MNFTSLFERLPFAISSAAAFYALVVCALLLPKQREWLLVRLSPPMPSTGLHFGALDAFRGLAALFVATFHIYWWPQPAFDSAAEIFPFIRHGQKAVPIFAALSGFLIYRSVRNYATAADLAQYATRRFLRIVPLYIVSVIALLVLGHFRGSTSLFKNLLAEIFMVRAIGFPNYVNPPVWSLYVEVLFYAVLPAFVVATRGWVVRASLASFVLLALIDVPGPQELALWKYFLAGIVASEMLDDLRDLKKPSLFTSCIFAGVVLLVADFCGMNWFCRVAKDACGTEFTTGLALAVMFLMVGSVGSSTANRLLSAAPLRLLGAISYSVFIWHSLIIVASFPLRFDGKGGYQIVAPIAPMSLWAIPLVMIPAVLFWATISFVFIEKPFLAKRPLAVAPRGAGGQVA